MTTIPFAEFKTHYQNHKAELDAAIQSVLDAGWYVLGEQGRSFEREFADYLGADHALGVANGTDAIALALRALGVGPGDEVIVPAMTAFPTPAAVRMAGATPIFADVEPQTLCIDPHDVARRITARTKAIVPVHLYGHAADLTSLLALDLPIVEDCAQSHGTTWHGQKTGTFGSLAAFSFYPSKNLGAFGDGGAVVASDPELAERVRMLRNYGEGSVRYHHELEGVNSRLDELQAAILRVKLRHLESALRRRRTLAAHYNALLDSSIVETPTEQAECVSTFHLYVVRTDKRDALREFLTQHGIGTQIHYPIPQNRQAAFAYLGQGDDCPIAQREAQRILSLPLYPELSEADLETVASTINAFRG